MTSYFRRHRKKVFAVKLSLASGDVICGIAGKHHRQCGLARAVRPHYGVHFAGTHLEIYSAENLLTVDFRVKILDFKHNQLYTIVF